MDRDEAYRWARIFNSDWTTLAPQMAERAATLGLEQKEETGRLIWRREGDEQCRWIFIDDPSDIEAVRAIFNDDANVASPACYVVVKQPDPDDDRGDVIFDMFRLNAISLLWHFNRVYTEPPAKKQATMIGMPPGSR